MVLPKRTKAITRITSARISRPVSFMRSRDFWRSYHSGVLGCCSHDIGGSEATAPFYAPELLHIPFGGVVIEVHSGRLADVAVSLPEKFHVGSRSWNSIAINWIGGAR